MISRTHTHAMRTSFLLRTSFFLVTLTLLFSACGAKQQPEHDTPTTIEKHAELPERCAHEACINHNVDAFEVDGIRVIVKHQETPPLVVARIYFEGGAIDWTQENEGQHALALDVVTDGGPANTDRHTYHAKLEEVAAAISSSVSRDYSIVGLFSPAFSLEGTFELMAQSLLAPAFEKTQLENSRAQQLAAIRTRFDDADSAVAEVVRALAWKDHPYALHALGEEETVARATQKDLQQALDALLVRERMIVVFSGKVDNQTAQHLVKTYLKDVKSQPDWAEKHGYPETIRPFAYAGGALEILERSNIPTNYILGYFAAPNAADDTYAATVIAMRILRDRLFKEVRTKRNLSYAVSSALGERRANTGALYVTATQPKETLQVMYDTIDQMIEEGVDQEDIDNEVRTYLTRYYMDLQSFSSQGHQLAKWQILTGDRLNADRFIDALRAVTPEQIRDALDRTLRNIQFGVVGNPEQIDREQFEAR